jgi:glycosyltransferase involved in cell wall biosynthesis
MRVRVTSASRGFYALDVARGRRWSIVKLRVAMIGQRGVPATFGGIERHVEELGQRLVERGHEVTVFCRSNYLTEITDSYRGMQLRSLPTIGTKHFDAIAHSAVSTLSAMRDSYDVLHYHALGPGMLALLPRLTSRSKVVLTVHGLDHERAKWSRFARAVLKTAGWMSARVPDATIVVSRALEDHYASHHDRVAHYIPNGAPARLQDVCPDLALFGLQSGRYILFVGRFVPEKNPDVLIQAFRRIREDVKLVVVGGNSFTGPFVEHLREIASPDPRIIFPGYVFGERLQALYNHAAAFVLPSSIEGLPITLLEAASFGTPVIVSDIPPHLEVVERDGPGHRVAPTGDTKALAAALQAVLQDPVAERLGAAALRDRVTLAYQWDDIAEATEALYMRLVRPRRLTMPITVPSTNGSHNSHRRSRAMKLVEPPSAHDSTIVGERDGRPAISAPTQDASSGSIEQGP